MDAVKFQDTGLAIGMDLGGHHLRGAVVNSRGELCSQKQVTTHESRELNSVLRQVDDLARELQAEYSSQKILGACIGIPGFMNHDSGFLTSSPNFPHWNQVNLHQALKDRVTIPCLTENDANLAGLGEYWLGAGKDATVLICLTLGTGVGGAVIQHGKLLKGARGLAGELGHLMIDPEGPLCGCGAKGCLETLASGTYVHHLTGSSAKDVYDRARNGDEPSIEVFNRIGQNLGRGLSSLAQIFDPDLFVIGGQVILAWDFFYPTLLQEFSERMAKHPARSTPIVKAACGNDAGILGAAYRVLKTDRQSAKK